MKKNGIIKFLFIYIIAKAITLATGLSYNIFTKEFNLMKLIIDIAIWAFAYFIVNLVFSKLSIKQRKEVQ
ncbi:hypothetical protein GOQ27_13980 [Clostridium sp. D2Q-11]|uniref:Uncharacterized protein n=1 Tax=Anaeromonas frigoriresistens TaxID=2683708 RepID=A0A942UUP7_9FIRM|nr:hypothetical protein [Anaeromonas frigoriresistens]MBS4539579.1 hypothetical protein [Anaeromonas frigoriresistens]